MIENDVRSQFSPRLDRPNDLDDHMYYLLSLNFLCFATTRGPRIKIPNRSLEKKRLIAIMTTPSTSTVPKITLHWLEVSRSQRILWLLEELQIPYELKTYKRGAEKQADPKLKEVHPLGKSPVLTIERGDGQEPLVLIESAAMTEYLCDYYGKHLIPTRFPVGKEGQIGAETESWLRYRTFMHYAEGSLMPLNLMALIMRSESRSRFCHRTMLKLILAQPSRTPPFHSSSNPSPMESPTV